MSKSIIVVGSGGLAKCVTNIAHSRGMSVLAFVDDDKAGSKVLGIPVITKEQL